MSCIADVARIGAGDGGETCAQGGDHILRIKNTERRLGDEGDLRRIGNFDPGHVIDATDDMQAAGDLPARAFNFRVAAMADQDHVKTFFGVGAAFLVDLAHQRTGGINNIEVPALGRCFDGCSHAMGAKNGCGARRDLIDLADENRTLGAQFVDHGAVMHDFVANIDRLAVKQSQRPLHDVDSAHDASTKPARSCQDDTAMCQVCLHGFA